MRASDRMAYMQMEACAPCGAGRGQLWDCLDNPVNAVDSNGEIVIFVNGLDKFGAGKAGPMYWGGCNSSFVTGAKIYFNDNNILFVPIKHNPFSSASDRFILGYNSAIRNVNVLTSKLKEGETIKFVTHSMGAAFAEGMAKYLVEQGYDIGQIVHINAYQAHDFTSLGFYENTQTTDYQNTNDPVINNIPFFCSPGYVLGSQFVIREKADDSFLQIHSSPIFSQGINFWKTLHNKQIGNALW